MDDQNQLQGAAGTKEQLIQMVADKFYYCKPEDIEVLPNGSVKLEGKVVHAVIIQKGKRWRFELLPMFSHLKDKHVQMEYLPTSNSRKWRQAFSNKSFGNHSLDHADKLMAQDGFAKYRFVLSDYA